MSQLPQQSNCNCRGGPGNCPVQGKCQDRGVVYKTTLTERGGTGTPPRTYIGMTGRWFKERWDEHKYDIRHPGEKEKTKLSTHCWDLQARGINYDLEWKIIDRATTFNPTTKKCRVCLKEKYHIMYSKDSHPLNKRQEIFSTCRHMPQKRLSNVE